MNLKTAQSLSYEQLRKAYREYLLETGLSKNTIQTAYSDTFYLWRNGSPGEFWSSVAADDFDSAAKAALSKELKQNSSCQNIYSIFLHHRFSQVQADILVQIRHHTHL